ncbi:MAG: sulfotransferase [Wenzhouxiangellaceae bacterium]
MKLFFASLARAVRLWLEAFVAPWTEGRSPAGSLLVVVLWPLFCGLQLLHWIGFALDEVFFRGWRRIEVRQPLFVLGPPRSGTTHLPHVVSLDEQTTTFRTWVCLFGLSVTERLLGRPFGRVGAWFARRFLAGMEDVHPFALDAPEEDFLALMPAMQCFILIVAFPRAEWLWRTARLDQSVGQDERESIMRFYRACVQKHMYVLGRDKRFLSKNASFSGMAEALMQTFPDARIMSTTRDPKKTVPSQLSSIEPGLAAVGFRRVPVDLRDRLVDQLLFYYLHLEQLARRHPDRIVVIDNDTLRDDLEKVVEASYRRLGLAMSGQFSEALELAGRRSRGFASGHEYTLEEYGLSEAMIEQQFEAVYRQRGFGRAAGEPVAQGAGPGA